MFYKINEIFYSLQGEGARAGTANVFVRFADCNLSCGFCDTEFESGEDMTAGEIAGVVAALMTAPQNVILTGGEPLLQYDQALHDALRLAGVGVIACETNGAVHAKAPLDWICISPKVAEHVVKNNFPNGAQEVRYVRHVGQAIPEPMIDTSWRFVSPEFNGDRLNAENLSWCVNLVKENPTWRLSLQMHKAWKIR